MSELTSSPRPKSQQLNVRMFDGLQAYEPVWHAMQSFTDQRILHSADELWVMQHAPVFTQGQAGKAEHVLAPGDIPVVKVDRGGQVTYHGPGQLVIYLLIDIARMGIGSRELVSRIEKSIVKTLGRYGLKSAARQDAPGVYIDGLKIASIGLRIRHGKSFHGLSLNVDMDLEPFNRINPCGYSDLKMTQLVDYEQGEVIEQVAGRLVGDIQAVFGYSEILMEYCESV